MKTIKISFIAMALLFAVQFAKAQVRFGVSIGVPAPYHRVVVANPYGYGYYGPAYYHPYVYRGYYARPAYHRYYPARVYRRRW